MLVPILTRVTGTVAFLLTVLSYQQNTRKRILCFQLVSTTLFVIQFSLLGAATGAILNLIGAVRTMLFFLKGKNKLCSGIFLPSMMILCSIIAGIFTYSGPISLLPCVGMIASTISTWQTKPKMVRLIGLPSSPLWLIYNIACGSYEGAITEAFVMTSIIVGMIRFDFKKTKQDTVDKTV